ncbi:hypothetical protein N9937_00615 [bacterium]|nr:hypothetical protein [bacterium]
MTREIKRVFFLTDITTSVLQYMIRDMAHGFRKLGIEVMVFVQRFKDEPLTGSMVDRAVREFNPDVVFQMLHLRGEQPRLWASGPIYVTWVQDFFDLHYNEYPGEFSGQELVDTLNKKDLIFCSAEVLRQKYIEAGYNQKNLHLLPVGANMDLYHRQPVDTDTPFSIGHPRNIAHPGAVGTEEGYNHRLDPVKWLLKENVNLHMWGEGWDAYPEFCEHSSGLVRNGVDQRIAYQKHDAILSTNWHGNLHQRLFETVACGRPVLMQAHEDDAAKNNVFDLGVPGLLRYQNRDELIAHVDALKTGKVQISDEEYDAFREANDYTARCKEVIRVCSLLD